MRARKLTWHQAFALESLPWIGRLHTAACQPPSRRRDALLQRPARQLFKLAYALGFGGRGTIRLNVKGSDKTLTFDTRNLQFETIYMPQFTEGCEPVVTLLNLLVGAQDVFYDVGSNWGYYSLLIGSRANYTGAVHAFEPLPSSFADLTSVVAQAGLDAQIVCHNIALSDRTGIGYMRVLDGLHSGIAKVTADGGDAEISLQRMDDLKLEPPNVIKIDVEGHEGEVLAGGIRTLGRARPMVVFESWIKPEQPSSTLSPLILLQDLGYAFFYPSWLVESDGYRYGVSEVGAREGELLNLALIPFDAEQRFVLKPYANILACHRDKLASLSELFDEAKMELVTVR
jgi:FkbM family methyltransferase